MSRSITSVVRGRALNSGTQNKGRLATYVAPVTHTRLPGPGSVARVTILSGSELGQAASTTINSTSDTVLFTYSYSPALPTSKIIVDYVVDKYVVSGNASSGNDAFESWITVNNNKIASGFQQWLYAVEDATNHAPGSGGRSGALFPLMGAYNNVNNNGNINNNYNQYGLVPVSISAKAKRTSGDDAIAITSSNNATWLRITEVVA